MMTPLLFLLSLILSIEASEKPWASRHAEGWAWYHDRELIKTPTKPDVKKDSISELNTIKQELEKALATALIEPSQENVIAYMALQKKWTLQSALFAKTWQHALLEKPELASLIPTTQYGVQVRKGVDSNIKTTLFKKLAARNTLLFFYEGKSPYSQAFANIVREFSKQYNWTVQAVSVDGVSLKSFPTPIKDQGIAKEMNVSVFPALYTVNVSSLQAVPIAFGMVTIHQIEENILLQFEEEL